MCHRRRRSSRTSSILTSSHDVTASWRRFGDHLGEFAVEGVEPACPQLGVAPLGNQVGDLEVALAGDHDQRPPGSGARDQRELRLLIAGQPEPPHVERHRVVADGQPRVAAHGRRAPVASHDKVGPQFARAVGAGVAHAGDPVAVAQQAGDVVLHPQREGGLRLRGVGDQVQQIPLRHHRDIGMRLRPEATEVDEGVQLAVDVELPPLDDAVRQPVEPFEQAELVEQAHGDRVHGVAAEVTQEVGVLLQHGHLDACAGQHQPQKQSRPGRPRRPRTSLRRSRCHCRPPPPRRNSTPGRRSAEITARNIPCKREVPQFRGAQILSPPRYMAPNGQDHESTVEL